MPFPSTLTPIFKDGTEVHKNRIFVILGFSPKALIMCGPATYFLFDCSFGGGVCVCNSYNIVILLLLLLSHFSRVRLCATQRRQPTRLPRPWDSPSKNTGVGCHFLLQCMKVKSESEVTQSCLTLGDPMDCSLPGSSIHGIFQARVLEWGAIAFSDIVTLSASKTLSCLYLPDGISTICLQAHLPLN